MGRINSFIKEYKLSHTGAFLTLFILFLILQFQSPWLIGFDGYFHIKFSYLLRDYFFIDKLPWLKYTIYSEYFRDHHLLFHYLLIPFTFGDLMTWGKIGAAFFMAFAGFSLYLIFKRLNVPYPFFWAVIGFASSSALLFRLEMLRIQSLSLAFLLIIFLLNAEKRYKLLFLFSMLFVYLYDAFPLVLIISGAFFVAEFFTERKLEFRYFLYSIAGIITGLIINPYFPQNITSFFFNIYRTFFLKVEGIKLGSEWYPYTSWGLIENMLLALIMFGLLILFLPFAKNIKTEEIAALVLALIFLVFTMKSRRFVEYSPVFIALAVTLIAMRRIDKKFIIAFLVMAVPIGILNFYKASQEIKGSPNPEIYKNAAIWIKNHSKEGEIVFNADWDDFPFLFFYNHKNYYIVGLDPMYMYKYDPKLYRLYQKITKGKIKKPAKIIKEKFKASYIFTDRYHKKLIKRLKEDPYAQKVYQDFWTKVYKVK
ncbi:MAG: hypothetical protein GXO22_07130 [Aquificae bacterium]|nr:hypothetical protein [Aquificota bacterium]